jgi:hypothetical protein
MAKRVILIVLGAVVLLLGAAVAVGGGALMIVFGSDGKASSGANDISTTQVALVASVDDINGTHGFATTVGRPTLQLSAKGSSRDVFLGVGPAAAVERYLAGASIARVTDFDVEPFRLTTEPRSGTAQPERPADQTFWTVSDSGTTATVDWKVSDGSYRLVVMNADAGPNVAVKSEAALTVPHVFGIGLGALIGGVVVALLGVLLIVLGARARPRPTPTAGAAQPVSV